MQLQNTYTPYRQRKNAASRPLGIFMLLVVLVILGACGTKRTPLPPELDQLGRLPQFGVIRFYGDTKPDQETMDRVMGEWAHQAAARTSPAFHILSLSGGGADGAFGAGFLNGWTESGTRPEFTMVTGVSTGALIAPFAFLGPDYDPLLKTVYTTFSTKNLVRPIPIGSALVGQALYNTQPFRKTLKTYLTEDVIRAIAEQHRQGRRLFIGTTNLDEMRPVYWDIGAMAQVPTEEARQLIRDVILASASVPVAFPPVYFTVFAHGQSYQEMHVDGGVTNQVFSYPPGIRMDKALSQAGVSRKITLYVIRNDALAARPVLVPTNLASIATRSLSGLIRNQGIGDLYRIYHTAKRDGADFNLAYIPRGIEIESHEMFDPAYMAALFEVGRAMALGSKPWHKTPPYDTKEW